MHRRGTGGALKAIKERDGVLESEQIRRALNDCIEKKCVVTERKRALREPCVIDTKTSRVIAFRCPPCGYRWHAETGRQTLAVRFAKHGES